MYNFMTLFSRIDESHAWDTQLVLSHYFSMMKYMYHYWCYLNIWYVLLVLPFQMSKTKIYLIVSYDQYHIFRTCRKDTHYIKTHE